MALPFLIINKLSFIIMIKKGVLQDCVANTEAKWINYNLKKKKYHKQNY